MNNKDRVPRLYKVAASVLTDFTNGKDSVKNLVYLARFVLISLDITIIFFHL